MPFSRQNKPKRLKETSAVILEPLTKFLYQRLTSSSKSKKAYLALFMKEFLGKYKKGLEPKSWWGWPDLNRRSRGFLAFCSQAT